MPGSHNCVLVQGKSGNHEIIAGLRLSKAVHNGNIGTVGRMYLSAYMYGRTSVFYENRTQNCICPVLGDEYCEYDMFVDIFWFYQILGTSVPVEYKYHVWKMILHIYLY
jgi:hypothetical protein